MSRKIDRILSRYFIIYFILVFFGFIFLKYYSGTHFSPDKLNYIITTSSSRRDKTDNLCKYEIKGDPVFHSEGYYKINLFCINGSSSLNTLSLVTVGLPATYNQVIGELARINGFDKDLIIKNNSWECHLDNKIINFTDQIIPNTTLNCHQNK